MLNTWNKLVKKFRMIQVSRERIELDAQPFSIRIVGSDSADPRVYSPPTAPELAALIVGDLDAERCKFDIVVEPTEGPLKRISPLHHALMSLQYPLLFPYGDKGFYVGMRYAGYDGALSGGRSEVSMLEYYAYRCHYRKDQPNPYLCCGRLSQQACVDAYECVESSRLSLILKNQDKLRSETYQGISDAVGQGSATGRSVGVRVLLPSGFVGSRRYMAQNYQDAMSICRCYGPLDLFVTFTCNPKWDEIADALRFEVGQIVADRPDIVSRVFKMKLDELYGEVKKGISRTVKFLTRYTWYSGARSWVKRGHGFTLGRIRHVSPSTGELFYMRMLLMAVRGAQGFEDLKRHAGVTHVTYREACQARGLLGDDSEWARVFDETVVWATSPQLRNLFVTILMYCDAGDAGKLFERYWRYLVDDFLYMRRQALRNQEYMMSDSLQKAYLLKELAHLFANNGGSLALYNLPDVVPVAGSAGGNRLISGETCYNSQEVVVEWQSLHSRLNSD
ncbi:hypothetical protein ACQ4PT_004242 [Festuca glaucescens]